MSSHSSSTDHSRVAPGSSSFTSAPWSALPRSRLWPVCPGARRSAMKPSVLLAVSPRFGAISASAIVHRRRPRALVPSVHPSAIRARRAAKGMGVERNLSEVRRHFSHWAAVRRDVEDVFRFESWWEIGPRCEALREIGNACRSVGLEEEAAVRLGWAGHEGDEEARRECADLVNTAWCGCGRPRNRGIDVDAHLRYEYAERGGARRPSQARAPVRRTAWGAAGPRHRENWYRRGVENHLRVWLDFCPALTDAPDDVEEAVKWLRAEAEAELWTPSHGGGGWTRGRRSAVCGGTTREPRCGYNDRAGLAFDLNLPCRDQLISAPERFFGSVTEGQIDTLPVPPFGRSDGARSLGGAPGWTRRPPPWFGPRGAHAALYPPERPPRRRITPARRAPPAIPPSVNKRLTVLLAVNFPYSFASTGLNRSITYLSNLNISRSDASPTIRNAPRMAISDCSTTPDSAERKLRTSRELFAVHHATMSSPAPALFINGASLTK